MDLAETHQEDVICIQVAEDYKQTYPAAHVMQFNHKVRLPQDAGTPEYVSQQ
jgi:hypothetical protein